MILYQSLAAMLQFIHFRAIGEFGDDVYFYHVYRRDQITTSALNDNSWKYNFKLFGRTKSSPNAIKLNNYITDDGGNWKSYVFLAGKPDPLTFIPRTNLNQHSFYIPGLGKFKKIQIKM